MSLKFRRIVEVEGINLGVIDIKMLFKVRLMRLLREGLYRERR